MSQVRGALQQQLLIPAMGNSTRPFSAGATSSSGAPEILLDRSSDVEEQPWKVHQGQNAA